MWVKFAQTQISVEPRGVKCLLPILLGSFVLLTSFDAAASAKRFVIVGDSNIYGALGAALEDNLESLGHGVSRFGVSGSGLARPDFFDWSLTAVGLVQVNQPDIVLLMVGANDTQAIVTKEGTVPWGQRERWSAEYERRLRHLVNQMRAHGSRVVMLGPTNRRSHRHSRKLKRLRRIQQHVARDVDALDWIDLFPLSTDQSGQYLHEGVDVFGRQVKLRMNDGRHLTSAGGAEVARSLLVSFADLGLIGRPTSAAGL